MKGLKIGELKKTYLHCHCQVRKRTRLNLNKFETWVKIAGHFFRDWLLHKDH